MRQFITDSWHGVMNHRRNPLRHVPDENVRHLIMQLLAWMLLIGMKKIKNFLTKNLIMLILQNTGDKYGKYKKSYISRCNQATTRRG
jgi:hypothetical protein